MKASFFLLGLLSAVLAYDDDDVPPTEEEIERAAQAMQRPHLFGGDMRGITFDSGRNALVEKVLRWPHATVPYIINSDLKDIGGKHGKRVMKEINKAFEEYHNKTCIRFVKRTHEKDYLELTYGDGSECSSDIGRSGGRQNVYLGKDCFWKGNVLHELGHAIGFFHEHQRSDRDEFVTVILKNVKHEDKEEFIKLQPDENILYLDYSYDSIMHYGGKAFSKNGEDTIIAKNGQILKEPVNKKVLSEGDIKSVKKMYHCP